MAHHLENVTTSIVPVRVLARACQGRPARPRLAEQYVQRASDQASQHGADSQHFAWEACAIYIFPTCELANSPTLFIGRWKSLPDECDGVISSFLDLGDPRSIAWCASVSARRLSPLRLRGRRVAGSPPGLPVDRDNVVKAMQCYNVTRLCALRGQAFHLPNVARTDTAVEGRIVGLYQADAHAEEQALCDRDLLVTSVGACRTRAYSRWTPLHLAPTSTCAT